MVAQRLKLNQGSAILVMCEGACSMPLADRCCGPSFLCGRGVRVCIRINTVSRNTGVWAHCLAGPSILTSSSTYAKDLTMMNHLCLILTFTLMWLQILFTTLYLKNLMDICWPIAYIRSLRLPITTGWIVVVVSRVGIIVMVIIN